MCLPLVLSVYFLTIAIVWIFRPNWQAQEAADVRSSHNLHSAYKDFGVGQFRFAGCIDSREREGTEGHEEKILSYWTRLLANGVIALMVVFDGPHVVRRMVGISQGRYEVDYIGSCNKFVGAA